MRDRFSWWWHAMILIRVYVLDCVVYVIPGVKNPKLLLNNYDFHCKKKSARGTLWWCSARYRTLCKAKLYTHGTVVEIHNNHNHEPKADGYDHKREIFKHKMTFIKK